MPTRIAGRNSRMYAIVSMSTVLAALSNSLSAAASTCVIVHSGCNFRTRAREALRTWDPFGLRAHIGFQDSKSKSIRRDSFSAMCSSNVTLIVTAGCDPLADEGLAYAEALSRAGVAVEHRVYPGMLHGFINTAGALDQARDAVARSIDALKAALRG